MSSETDPSDLRSPLDSHLRAVVALQALRGPQVALLGPGAVAWVLRDPLGASARSIHGAHGGRAPVGSRPRAHTSGGHARRAAGSGVGHVLVVIGLTPHLI